MHTHIPGRFCVPAIEHQFKNSDMFGAAQASLCAVNDLAIFNQPP